MDTPIYDFLRNYQQANTVRFHMPGHKGVPFLGCEPWDLTEVQGADALYEAQGIIAASEENTTALFDSGKTVYSTEGSSQCIRAMLYLAVQHRPDGSAPLILAARNVHKAFVYACALLDLEVAWLWPQGDTVSLCGCPVTASALDKALTALPRLPAAVYITSPDYLGGMADVAALAQVCHCHGTRLLVDNAHGAYLHFLQPSRHPLDLGADLCCDSAHKTLPVLTGGAYLHLSRSVPTAMMDDAKNAMALFGSTSPSYLTLASLDLCNRYLQDGYTERLLHTAQAVRTIGETLTRRGWNVLPSDPLRLTVSAPAGYTGGDIADRLRQHGIECEYADPEFTVLMVTPENTPEDFARLTAAFGTCPAVPAELPSLPVAKAEPVVSVRKALFTPHETIPATAALGRICGAPTVSCPPAIPIVVSGERIGAEALILFAHYGIDTVDVLKP